MKRHPLTIVLFITLALVLACAGVVLANLFEAANAAKGRASVKEGIVRLDAGLTQTKIFSGSDTRLGLALTLACDDVEAAHAVKQHVDLVVVLDRSGSMAGRKIQDARSAVSELIRALGPGDRFALVSYSSDVTVHGSLTPVTSQTRPALAAMAMSVQAGGGTNLGGGLAAGMELVAQARYQHVGRRSQSKVILISDGHANQGVVDPLALGNMASRGYRDDFSVTTVGVGVEYNEHLMGVIADYGGGNYYFLENPSLFAQLFLEELSLTRAVAARNVEIQVPLPNGATLRDAAGYPVEMRGRTAVLRPGGLRTGQERTIFLTLGFEPGTQKRYDIMGITATYQRDDTTSTLLLNQPLTVEVVGDRAAALASIDPALWERQTVQEDYNRLREAVSRDVARGDKDAALAKIGQYEQEKRVLNSQVKSEVVADNLLNGVAELKATVEKSLAPGASDAMRKHASKAMQSESYDIRRSKNKY